MALTDRERAKYLARLDLAAFAACIYPSYQKPVPAHLAMINSALEAVAQYIESDGAEGIGKLRIEVHPRSGKSQTVARIFPAWVLGKFPDTRIIIASYGEKLSEDHARAVRNTLRSGNYASIFPKVKLAPDSQAKDAWDLADPAAGGLISVGLNGAVTGKGAGLLICDDLVKGRAEAESRTIREQTWSWYTNDLLTRLNSPFAPIIHIGTRWREDDLLGTLAANEPEGWHVIKLPALAEENDPLGREVGEALWPVTWVKRKNKKTGKRELVQKRKFDRAFLLEKQQAIGAYAFSALYQCDPIPPAGGIFEREKFTLIDEMPADPVRMCRFYDLALSQRVSADYTVGVLMALLSDQRLVVADVQRYQVNWGYATERIAATAKKDGAKVRIGIEKVFFHGQAVQELLNRSDMHDYSILGVVPDGDKVQRAQPFAARVSAGMVYVLRRAWTRDYIDELCSFDRGKHDDQVDASSGAYKLLGQLQPVTVTVRGWIKDDVPAGYAWVRREE